jgi:hypothetical protein
MPFGKMITGREYLQRFGGRSRVFGESFWVDQVLPSRRLGIATATICPTATSTRRWPRSSTPGRASRAATSPRALRHGRALPERGRAECFAGSRRGLGGRAAGLETGRPRLRGTAAARSGHARDPNDGTVDDLRLRWRRAASDGTVQHPHGPELVSGFATLRRHPTATPRSRPGDYYARAAREPLRPRYRDRREAAPGLLRLP